MIKTDKVIYRTRTLEEYDWLMGKLEEAGCVWSSKTELTKINAFNKYSSNCCIRLENKKMTHAHFAFYNGNTDFKDYEIIEVSDLMEDEEETEVLDKLEDLKRIENELKNLKEEDDESQKIKKIVCTTEVYFE